MPRYQYQYLKLPGHRNPVTISYEITTKPHETCLMMVVGVSVCHNKDNFSKKIGRNIADKRRQESPHYVGFVNLDPSVSFGRRIVGSIHNWFNASWDSLIKNP